VIRLGCWRGRAARGPLPWSPVWLTPDRAWGAVVIGEYERAFCGSQLLASVAPLFEYYGIRTRRMPRGAGGRR
jgi:hypothetical protein